MIPSIMGKTESTFTEVFKSNSLKLVEKNEYSYVSPVIIFSVKNNGIITSLEGSLKEVNLSQKSIIGCDIYSNLSKENEFLSKLKDIIFDKGKTSGFIEVNGYCFEVSCSHLTDPSDNFTGTIGMAKDITEKLISEENQNIQNNHYAQFFENSPQAIAILNFEDRIVNINKSFEDLFKFTLSEIKGNYINDVIVPPEMTADASELSYKVINGMTVKTETVRVSKDGEPLQVSVIAYPYTINEKNAGVFAVYNDISKRKRNDEQIMKSLVEKEILLKEIHHRVKNNLQIIGSLLNFQTKFIKDADALEKFKTSQNRIKSIALIHEKLYQTKNVSRIEFTSYVKSLVAHIFTVFGADPNRITCKINANNTFLSVDNAIPCGLIINELVTNSLKYAFPDNRRGEVCIDLEYKNTNYYLKVSDNGVGIPKDINVKNSDTLGMQLVKTLLVQLNAEMEINDHNGTSFSIVFSNMNYKERI